MIGCFYKFPAEEEWKGREEGSESGLEEESEKGWDEQGGVEGAVREALTVDPWEFHRGKEDERERGG